MVTASQRPQDGEQASRVLVNGGAQSAAFCYADAAATHVEPDR
jgi:hypothetical protein